MTQFRKLCLLVFSCAALAGLANAQIPVKVQKAELSVNFGVARGRLVTAGDLLIFVDEDNADGSFAIEKAGIRNLSEQDGIVTIETAKPVRDRSGEKSRLAFRLTDGGSATLMAWYKDAAEGGAATTARSESQSTAARTDPAKAAAEKPGSRVYQAKQKRFPFGSSNGKFVITDNMLAFESFDDIKRSRQWELKDIREIKQTGPYILQIVPFTGDKYQLELQGQGMTSSEFKALTDRIAAARVSR
jgi:hypothetical protein